MPAGTEPIKVYFTRGTAWMAPTSRVVVARGGRNVEIPVSQIRDGEEALTVGPGRAMPHLTPYSMANPRQGHTAGPPAQPQPEPQAAAPAPAPAPAQTGGGGGGTPPPAAPATPDAPAAPPVTAVPMTGTEEPGADQLIGVPEGAQLWRIGGKVYVAYYVPGTKPPVPILWHVRDIEDLGALTGGRQVPFAQDIDGAQAARLGAIIVGTKDSTDLVKNAEDLYEDLVESFGELARTNPAMLDPEILAITTQAALEGRTASDPVVQSRIQQTNWWQSHNAAEREWMSLAMSDPATATQRSEANRILVRNMLVEAGYKSPPQSLVNYISNRLTDGRWTEVEARDAIRRETDPYAPGASPFAGRYLPEGAEAVTHNGRTYIQYDGKLYEMTGPGQSARYAEGARGVRQAPKGRHVVDAQGRHFFEAADGKLYLATGEGQVRGLERLYGEAHQLGQPQGELDVEATRRTGQTVLRFPELEIAGDVVGFFGGPGGIETYIAGEPQVAGDVGQILGAAEERALGEEERVRSLMMTWIGPYYAGNFDEEWIAREAGALRNGGAGAEERLIAKLRDLRLQFFPGWSPDQTYEDIAAYGRGQWQRFSGAPADEMDAFFLQTLNKDLDAQQIESMLRKEGLARGWAPTVSESTQGLFAQIGGQVRRSAV